LLPGAKGGREVDEQERLCEACGRRRATVHLTDFVEGQPIERHLCRHCFEAREGVELPPAVMLAHILSAVAPELREMSARQCPDCGISYLEFRQNLQLGCPRDYKVFDKALDQLIERFHGASAHCGKAPPGEDGASAVDRRIRSLQHRQREAIAEEDYELAAHLRDRIRTLQGNGPEEPEC